MPLERLHIPPPEHLERVLDVAHDQCGVADVESVRGGTQVNLSGAGFKCVQKLLRAIPDHEAISGLWTTRIAPGGYHVTHAHPEGTRSGVYYIRTGKGGELLIGSDRVTPEPGMLLMFDSSLPHGTTPFEGDGTRLTVAFDMR